MMREHKAVFVGRNPDQRDAQKRRARHIEPHAAVLRQYLGQLRLALARAQLGEIKPVPSRRRRSDLHLHCTIELLMRERHP